MEIMNDDGIFNFKSLRRSRRSIVREIQIETTNLAGGAEGWSRERSPKKFLSNSMNSKLVTKDNPLVSRTSYDGKQKAARQKDELSKLQKYDKRVATKAVCTGKHRRREGQKKSVSVQSERTESSSTQLNASGGIEKLSFQKMHVALSSCCENVSRKDHQESPSPLSAAAAKEAIKMRSDFSLPSKIGYLDPKHKDNSAGYTSSLWHHRMIKKPIGTDGSEGIDGRCPFCQMPFSVLKLESPNNHTMECMDIPLKATKECPAGLSCVSIIPSHYRRFLHSHLALQLAGLDYELLTEQSCKDHLSHSSEIDRHFKDVTECQRNRADICSPRKRKLLSPGVQTAKSKVVKGSPASSNNCWGDACSGSRSILVYLSPKAKEGNSYLPSKGGSEKMVEEALDVLTGSCTDNNEGEGDGENSCVIKPTTEAGCETAGLERDCHEPAAGASAGSVLIQADSSDNVEKHLNDDTANLSDIPEKGNSSAGNSCDEPVILDAVSEASSNVNVVSGPQESSNFSKLPQTCLQKQTSLLSFFQPKGQTTQQRQPLTAGRTKILKGLSVRVNQKIGHESDHQLKQGLPKSASEPVITMLSPAVHSLPTFVQTASKTGMRRGNSDWPGVVRTIKGRVSGRQCPFYKKISGTKITVDAFDYGEIVDCEAYVLTHFHSDHYKGLTKRFSQPIFCSPVTGNLVEKQLGVATCWINRLPLNKPCQVTGVWLTLMEANHCPGAVIVLFELPDGKKMLHTGDFRADPSMESYPSLIGINTDELYLDTTYCDPAYAFPPQSAVVKFAVDTALEAVEKFPRTLVVCGAYTIGKERIFAAVAEALASKVCVQVAKKRVLDCLDDPHLKSKICMNWSDGRVHVLPMAQLNPKSLEAHLQKCPQFTSVLAFEPTGWTHSKNFVALESIRPKYARQGIIIFGIPYSEHSSFLELKRFVQFIRPKKIIPTVNNGSPASRKKMEVIFKEWLSEQKSIINTTAEFSRRSSQQSFGSWLSLKN